MKKHIKITQTFFLFPLVALILIVIGGSRWGTCGLGGNENNKNKNKNVLEGFTDKKDRS